MTRIRATCPSCGEVDLRPTDVTLTLIRDVFDEVGDGSCYHFDCPTCADTVTKPADERIARLLTTGGVEVHDGEPVLEPHPESPPAGDPLTLDDLIAFHEMLASDSWFVGLESMTP